MTEKGRPHVKRLVSIAALAAAVAVIVVPAATPASGKDYTGPKCANITSGMGGYTGTAGSTGTVDFVVQYAAPVCSSITYAFAVTDQTGAVIGNGDLGPVADGERPKVRSPSSIELCELAIPGFEP